MVILKEVNLKCKEEYWNLPLIQYYKSETNKKHEILLIKLIGYHFTVVRQFIQMLFHTMFKDAIEGYFIDFLLYYFILHYCCYLDIHSI